jgi:hypothetical protein
MLSGWRKAGPRNLGPALPCVFDAADGLPRRSKCLSVQGGGGVPFHPKGIAPPIARGSIPKSGMSHVCTDVNGQEVTGSTFAGMWPTECVAADAGTCSAPELAPA